MINDFVELMSKNYLKTHNIIGKQDGGVGRHTAPPRTTKRRTTTI